MLTILLVFLFLYAWWRLFSKEVSNIPGPLCIPFLGCPLWLTSKRGFLDWLTHPSVIKNPISFIQIGPTVKYYIINDFRILKELFSKEEFSHRSAADFQLKHRFVTVNKPDGIMLTNGDQWSHQRRFALKTLKDFGFGKQFLESTINTEIDEMITKYSLHQGDIKIGSDFNIPVISILWKIVSGSRITMDSTESVRMVELVNEIFAKGNFHLRVLRYSFLKHFPNITGYKNRAEILEEHKAFMLKIIDEHEETFEAGQLKDFIDVYLDQMKSDNSGKYSKGDLSASMIDFFHGGTETTSTTLKWVLLYLALNQDDQEACRREIKEVLGETRAEVAHMSSLPYTVATITEIQRLSSVAPLSLDHETTEQYNYREFTFPKGAVIFANLRHIMTDPKYFDEPLKFKPKRFLDEKGNYAKNERVIPFGTGKRFCMGELLARNQIFLFTVNLIQQLRIQPSDNHPLPNPENYCVNLTRIPDDFYVKFNAVR